MCLNTWFPNAGTAKEFGCPGPDSKGKAEMNSLEELHHTLLLAERMIPELCCDKFTASTFNLKLEITYETAK